MLLLQKIPNPEEYLELVNGKGKDFHSTCSPVIQIRYIINLETGKRYVFNDKSRTEIELGVP